MTNDWSNPYTRETKRKISIYEKATLPIKEGRALIMPGEPPRKDQRGEAEELIMLGWDPLRIIGVEEEEHRAVELYDHYYDRMQIHLEEIGLFLRKAYSHFSYIHFDFCGHLKHNQITAIESAMNHTASHTRIRVSTLASRRSDAQIEDENVIRRKVLKVLCEQLGKRDPGNEDRWELYWQELQHSTDTTQVIFSILLLNYIFGMQLWSFSDLSLDRPFLPEPKGMYQITNVQRFVYSEMGNSNSMFTIWVDLAPQQAGMDQERLVRQMNNLFADLVQEIPTFVPQLYTED